MLFLLCFAPGEVPTCYDQGNSMRQLLGMSSGMSIHGNAFYNVSLQAALSNGQLSLFAPLIFFHNTMIIVIEL